MGSAREAAWQQVREQVVFTTHTPVPAGNESYQRAEVLAMLGHIADLAGEREHFLALGRIDPANPNQPMGMNALALRASRHANAVSQRHGQVARAMWQPLFPGRAVQEVPITHITNGVHIPSWLRGAARAQLVDMIARRATSDRLGHQWQRRRRHPGAGPARRACPF